MSKILIISSDPVFTKKNVEVLRQNGLEVDSTPGCLDGLVMMRNNNFNVIVIDDKLSDVSCYEACLKVRHWRQGALIVLLGTIPDLDAWSREKELGFDLYLHKPVSPVELPARIKALLKRPGVEKEAVKAAVVSARTEIKGKEAYAQMAAQQPVRAAEPTYTPTVTPEPAVSGPVYVQPQPEPVKPEIKVPQQVSVEAPLPPPSIPPIPVQETPQRPVEIVPEPVAPQRREQVPVIVPPLERDVKRQPTAPVAVNSPLERPDSMAGVCAQTSQEDTGAAILEDSRVIKLVDALVSGKLPDIDPVIDFSYKKGFAYPSVSSLLDTSEVDTINILESLTDNGILIKQSYDKFYIDPDGLFQLVPIERCSRCDSSDIVRGQLVEHYSCGYVGLDRDFKQESRYVCPKCRKDLRLIGTDYRNVGIHYRCQDCNEVFTVPIVKWRNMKTRKIWTAEELKEVEAYSYRFSPDKKGWLEFQLKPKTQLVDFLKHQGYQVHELAQLTGRSGAVHTVDVLAIRDDIITKINLGIGILVAPSGEPEVGLEALFRFDTRAYDIGINYKVVIAIPRLGQEALNFAGRQMIRAFEAKTMATVVADITHLDRSNIGMQSRVEAGDSNTRSL
jgi:CheY-like chemotaxis protein